jgi:hypothetical protein
VSTWTHLDWHRDWPRRGNVWPPLVEGHPLSLNPCLLCTCELGTLVAPQILMVGPVDDMQWDAHLAGQVYPAAAVLVHEPCLSKLDDSQVEDAVAEIAAFVRTGTP